MFYSHASFHHRHHYYSSPSSFDKLAEVFLKIACSRPNLIRSSVLSPTGHDIFEPLRSSFRKHFLIQSLNGGALPDILNSYCHSPVTDSQQELESNRESITHNAKTFDAPTLKQVSSLNSLGDVNFDSHEISDIYRIIGADLMLIILNFYHTILIPARESYHNAESSLEDILSEIADNTSIWGEASFSSEQLALSQHIQPWLNAFENDHQFMQNLSLKASSFYKGCQSPGRDTEFFMIDEVGIEGENLNMLRLLCHLLFKPIDMISKKCGPEQILHYAINPCAVCSEEEKEQSLHLKSLYTLYKRAGSCYDLARNTRSPQSPSSPLMRRDNSSPSLFLSRPTSRASMLFSAIKGCSHLAPLEDMADSSLEKRLLFK